MRKKIIWLTFAVAAALILLYRCTPTESQASENPYRNTSPSAKYVGIDKCRKCHESVYQTFKETGMGMSFDRATPKKSAANFDPAVAHVYDQHLDLHYRPYFQNDSLFIQEYRLLGADTVHSRTEHVSYIIGSGQHTNSHIISKNGYLYQAPITYYTQKKIWDFAPGFDGGSNSRFDRKIQLECMSCHNSMPTLQEGSLNKFLEVGHGIDCERCHGPGSIHVQEKESGIMVDTAKGPDFSIVNPRRLTTDQKNNICMRCHLQGVTVLEDGHSFYDFRPSMTLSDILTTFLPQYDGGEKNMIMASHVERMKMSKCYTVSNELSCINCHDPHVSVKKTPSEHFNNACKSCHKSVNHNEMGVSATAESDCISCHMPKTGSIDIPHVAVTDHYIRKTSEDKSSQSFRGIISYNNANPDNRTMTKGYLEIYERYMKKVGLLDSAAKYLPSDDLQEKVRLEYLRENFSALAEIADDESPSSISDAWTAYRLGEGCFQKKNTKLAHKYFERAENLMPFVTEFKLKNAISLMVLGQEKQGVQKLIELSKEDINNYLTYYNLAIYYQKKNNLDAYINYMNMAKKLNPDI